MTSEMISIGGLELRFLQTKENTAGSLDAFEMTVQPNARMPIAHYHESWDETVYGLAGGLNLAHRRPGCRARARSVPLHQARDRARIPQRYAGGCARTMRSHARRAWTQLFSRNRRCACRRRARSGKNEGDHAASRARAGAGVEAPTSRRDDRRRRRCPCRRGRRGSSPSGDPSGVWGRARSLWPAHAPAPAPG